MSEKTRRAIAAREAAKAPKEKRGRQAEQGNTGGQATEPKPAAEGETAT